MLQRKAKKHIQSKRVARIRAKVVGTSMRPRIAVHRSNRILTIQIIDDAKHETLMTARTDKDTIVGAKALGIIIAQKAKAMHISAMVFDRGGHKYHGVIKALADTVREGGVTI